MASPTSPLTDRLAHMIAIGILISLVSSILGYHAAVALDVSIGGMMAVMTGIFLAAAFLFGPRYGLLAQAWRRGSQRDVNESRVLAVHLYNHEDVPGADDENVIRTLGEHLRWSEKKVREVVARSLRLGFVLQDGARLYLTVKGRQTALELLEPWRVDAY